MASFEKAQQIVGLNEGGYQIDPRDTGNYYMGNLIGTNYGISAGTLASFLGRIPAKEEMQHLSRQTAEQILKATFWLRNNLDKLRNQSVATLIYDGVVHHGTNGMRFILEKVLSRMGWEFSYYQVFNPNGIELLNEVDQQTLFNAVKKARAAKYRQSSQTQYINGWLARLDRIQYSDSPSSFLPYAMMAIAGLGLILIVF